MPLPSVSKHGAKQCSAKSKRTRLPCKNPAAYGCRTCKMHGARKKESIKRGKTHPNYLHGERTKEAQAELSLKLCELRRLENLGHALGIVKGARTRGRKPSEV